MGVRSKEPLRLKFVGVCNTVTVTAPRISTKTSKILYLFVFGKAITVTINLSPLGEIMFFLCKLYVDCTLHPPNSHTVTTCTQQLPNSRATQLLVLCSLFFVRICQLRGREQGVCTGRTRDTGLGGAVNEGLPKFFDLQKMWGYKVF